MKLKYIKILAVGALLVLVGCNEINPDNYKQQEVSVGEKNSQPVIEKTVDTTVEPAETVNAVSAEATIKENAVAETLPTSPNANTTITTEYKDYSAELEKNALGVKPLVVIFTGTGCTTCKTLDADIKENIATIENAVILKADFSSHSELAAKYRVEEANTVVFVDKDGGSYNKKTGANINDIRNFLNTNR